MRQGLSSIFRMLCFLTCGLPVFAQAGEIHTNVSGVDVVLATAKGSYPPGTPVVISCMVSNGLDRQVFWLDAPRGTNNCDTTFSSTLVKVLPQATNLPCRSSESGLSGSRWIQLQPHQLYRWSENLSFEYGLSEPGHYELTVMLEMPSFKELPPGAAGMAPMPPITIEITNQAPCDSWAPKNVIESSGPAAGGLRAVAKLPKQEFAAGEAITAVLLVNNETDTNQSIAEPISTSFAELSLISEDGRAAAPAGLRKIYQENTSAPIAEPRGWIEPAIPARGRRWYDCRLDQLFDLSTPGKYTLSVRLPRTRRFGEPVDPTRNHPQLSCGPITFTIIQSATQKK